jgi:RNA polymerase sigma-54 factor
VGLYEFKYFFGSSLATEEGGATSSTAIRALIKQFIDAENRANRCPTTRLPNCWANRVLWLPGAP